MFFGLSLVCIKSIPFFFFSYFLSFEIYSQIVKKKKKWEGGSIKSTEEKYTQGCGVCWSSPGMAEGNGTSSVLQCELQASGPSSAEAGGEG